MQSSALTPPCCLSHLNNWEEGWWMCLIAGESKTTYVAHPSQPARGEKRQEPSPYPRDLAAPFKELFPDTSRQIESFFGGRGRQDTKDEEWEEEGGDVRGRERWLEEWGEMKSEDEEGETWIQEGESWLDFSRAGSAVDLKRSITSIPLLCYFRGSVAGKRENWGQAGRRQEQKGKEGRHISWKSYR